VSSLTASDGGRLDILDAVGADGAVAVVLPASWWTRMAAVVWARKWVVLWAVGVVVYETSFDLPMSRAPMFAILGTGLMALTFGNRRAWARIVRDWFPLFAILYAYDILRSVADTWLPPHVYPQIEFDRFVFGGRVPTVELQHALYTAGHPHLWDYVAFFTYLTHFIVPIGVAAVLWKVAHDKFRRYAFLFVSLTLVTFLTYLFYPAVPPWLASRSGAIAPTAKIVDDMWVQVGLKSGAQVFSATSHLANPVAAVPSLHTAYPVLIMLFFWGAAGRKRWLLLLYPLAMSWTLVYTAEHYVFDILLGWLYAFAVYFIGSAVYDAWLERRMSTPYTVATRRQFPWLRNREKAGTVVGG
jgi:hypothetical protein